MCASGICVMCCFVGDRMKSFASCQFALLFETPNTGHAGQWGAFRTVDGFSDVFKREATKNRPVPPLRSEDYNQTSEFIRRLKANVVASSLSGASADSVHRTH